MEWEKSEKKSGRRRFQKIRKRANDEEEDEQRENARCKMTPAWP